MNPLTLEALIEAARERWGEERVQALRAELQQLAEDLARVLAHRLDEGEEPGFFLLKE